MANRRHFDERLAEERARAKRDGTPLSLLLVDVDHFKKFNDQYGHQAGDACLRALVRILSARVRRPSDLAAGYGGEEFVLLLPNTDAEGCELVAENVRRALRKRRHAARFEPAVGHLAAHQKRLSQSGQRFREPPSSTNAGRIEAEPVQSYRRRTATLMRQSN
ncbi:GGDEF domain-containing protein [Bradyrhizobium vignae]|uniref:GGDEF domain-containing protein n=1 Tax=Bradyrhizobium sp. STM 3561 TaxID=578923 RepID=UPI001FCF1E0F|nr:GGDEF domain-containing protein [Bradyrhizobium vignae]